MGLVRCAPKRVVGMVNTSAEKAPKTRTANGYLTCFLRPLACSLAGGGGSRAPARGRLRPLGGDAPAERVHNADDVLPGRRDLTSCPPGGLQRLLFPERLKHRVAVMVL